MAVTISVPQNYGYVILGTIVGNFVANILLSGNVMKARKQYNVAYPNLYAVPGFHKEADAFNRVQRGHQHMMEVWPSFCIMNLIGGLKYPLACAAYGLINAAGSVLYQIGYMDTEIDVAKARYAKGGMIQYIGTFGSLYATISLAGSMIGWW